jgi:hypothetical protein
MTSLSVTARAFAPSRWALPCYSHTPLTPGLRQPPPVAGVSALHQRPTLLELCLRPGYLPLHPEQSRLSGHHP